MSTITFSCNACNQVLKVGAETAGKKCKCVKCGAILTIPLTDAAMPEIATPPRMELPPPRQEVPPRREDFEEDRGPRRRPRDDYDDEDRPSRRRDEEDYEDEPRRRRPRDEEEEDYDRPRRRPRDDEDDDYDRPRRRGRNDEDDYRRGKPWGSWSKVSLGLLLNYIASIALAAFAGIMLVSCLILIIGFAARSNGMAKTSQIISIIAFFVYILLGILIVVGNVFAIFAPNKKGAMILGIASLSVVGLGLIFRFIFLLLPLLRILDMGSMAMEMTTAFGGFLFVFPIVGQGGVGSFIVTILLILIIEAEWVVYPLYLRSLCLSLKKPGAAQGNMITMIVGSCAVGLKIILLIIIYVMNRDIMMGGMPGQASIYVRYILCILANSAILVFALFYMKSIKQTRDVVQDS